MVFKGKVYLAKIKESDAFGAADLLWGICQPGMLPFMGFRNLVTKRNGKGFFAPLLSTDRITWGEIKEKLKAHMLEQVGKPVCLFENVHTFSDMAGFAYNSLILTDPEGADILNNLTKGDSKPLLKDGSKVPKSLKEAADRVRAEAAMYARGEDVVIDLTEVEQQSISISEMGISCSMTRGQGI